MANPELSRRVDSHAVDLRVIGDTVLAVDQKVDDLAVKVTALDSKVTAMGVKVASLDTKVTAMDVKVSEHGAMLTEILGLLRQGR